MKPFFNKKIFPGREVDYKKLSLFILMTFFIGVPGWTLVPLESVLLGDFSKQYRDKETDPIEYVFKKPLSVHSTQDKDFQYRRQLALYRGFSEEGQNLKNFCKEKPIVQYSVDWDRQKAIRSVIATLQYIILDLSLRALPKYANYFEFSEEEYQNLGNNLIGNWCSQNISLISLKELKKNWMIKYTKENSFSLPSIENNPLFPQKIVNISSRDKAMKQEFMQTIKLFKSACSWGGDTDNLRLLVPFIRHPVIYAFVARQLSAQTMDWEPLDNKIVIKEEQETTRVLCRNLICRKVSALTMQREFPRGAGTKSIREDLDRLYCEELRDIDYLSKEQVPKIKKMIKSMSFDEEHFAISQLISLVTTIPDFFLRSDEFSDGKSFLRLSLDQSWDQWAQKQNKNFSQDIYYEEALSIELVNRKLYYSNVGEKFEVHFDVNLGEFDRANQMVGKISNYFNLRMSKAFLVWAKENWNGLTPSEKKKKRQILDRFKFQITNGVQEARKKFRLVPWKGDLEELIAKEVLEQVSQHYGTLLNSSNGMVEIPIHFNFAPSALRYVHYQYLVKENNKDNKKYFKELRERQQKEANDLAKLNGTESY